MLFPSMTPRSPDTGEVDFQVLKTSIHNELVASLDLAAVGKVDDAWMRREVQELSSDIIKRRKLKLSAEVRTRMLAELDSEVFGLGPLDPLMQDAEISDILVNNSREVYVERHGRLELTSTLFADDTHLLRIIQRIVSRIGRRIDEVSPMVDARLPDGSRVNAVVPPLALNGPKLSIRRFGAEHLKLERLLANEAAESVRRALQSLAAHYRDVIILYEMHDLSYVEIAHICNIDIGTVRSRLSRARAKLAELLGATRNAPHESAMQQQEATS